MGEPLRVLIVEDSEGDALLLLAHLKRHDYDLEWDRVEDLSSMSAALDQKIFDVVLADHSMPHFSTPAALNLVRERGLDVPFIIVSGAIGEETAAAAMKAGAHDYINKDNLGRLVPVIERELRDAAARRDHRRVEEALLESLQTSMETVQAIPSGLFIYQYQHPDRLTLVFGNPEAERLTRIRIEEWLGKDFNEIWPAAHVTGITESFLNVLKTGELLESEELFYRDNRLEGVFRIRAFPMAGNRLGVAFEDVTERKRAEEALAWESEVNAAVAELSKLLIEPTSIDDVASTILEYAKRLTGSTFGYVGYIDPSTGHLVSSTMTKDIWETCQVPDKDVVFERFSGLWGWVLDNHKPLLTNAPSDDSRSAGTPEGHIPIHRFLSAPAMIGDRLVGQISLANSDRDYSDRDLELIERMAALYAIAFQGKLAFEEIEDRSHKLGERVKELNCLYGISRLVERPDISLDEILQGTVELIPPSWQYPEITCARILVGGREFKTESCRETPWKQANDILVYGERVGSLEIFYLEERPTIDEGPFLKEERSLIDAIAERLGRIIERNRGQDALREALQESRKRAAETSALLESSRAILELSDLEQVEEAIFDTCKSLIGATAGYIAVLSDDGLNNEVIFLESGGRPCTVDPDLPMPIRGLRANAYASGKPVYDNNFDESEWTEFLPPGHVRMDNVMFAPLILDGKCVGVIGLANKPGGFTDEDARIAAAFGNQAAIALQNSHYLEALLKSEARYKKLSESLEDTVREKVAELKQAESLAAIGRMVSIVAHEVRNPLQNIQMGVDSMRNEVGRDKEKSVILEEIEYGVELLNGIIAELLDYSRPVTLKCSPQSVQDLVGHALKGMAYKLDNIDVRLELEQDDKEISVDSFRIRAVLMNLISNSAEAMPDGGVLTIISDFRDDNGVAMLRLSITDTGCGISEYDLEQIHEPFFTTKAKGTGLGIPVCKKIVETHSGRLEITSNAEVGTTARIWLPVESTRRHM
jgi:signal transduction histidine kinase/CheY-like chemotaxis protein